MDRLERTLALPQTKKIGSISYSDYDSPLFKPRELTKPLKFGNQNKNCELIKILTKKLETVHLTTIEPSSSKQQLNVLSGFESSYTETQTDNSYT